MRRYNDRKLEIDANLNKYNMQHFNYRVLILLSCLLLSSIVQAQTTRDEVYKQLNSFFESQRKKNNKRTVNTDNSVKKAINDYLNSNQFETKTFVFKKDQNGAHMEIKVDYPINGNADLVVETRLFIRSELENACDVNIAYSYLLDGQKLVNYAGMNRFYLMEQEIIDSIANPGCTNRLEIKKSYENSKCVSFSTYDYFDLGGNAGYYFLYGVTFRKEDGKRIMIIKRSDYDNPEFRSIVTNALKRKLKDNYSMFSEEDFENPPMPTRPPHLTKDGVRFDYTPEEAGINHYMTVSVIIPYGKIKQYMTDEAKELIE